MMIFTGGQVVIPSSRIYDIKVVSGGNYGTILIAYDCGDLINIEGKMYDKVEVVSVHYDSADECNKALRQFYKACRNNENAFYFGKNDGEKKNW